jgi:ATP/maltotriose-dependent transcriptional regulator MalT
MPAACVQRPDRARERAFAALYRATVNYHLANAMGKLKVDNKMAAIQRACWIGAI